MTQCKHRQNIPGKPGEFHCVLDEHEGGLHAFRLSSVDVDALKSNAKRK